MNWMQRTSSGIGLLVTAGRYAIRESCGAICLLAFAWVGIADATVYRWVDDKGKVHYSEIVPQQYQDVAKPIDVPAGKPTAEQRGQALDRTQKDKARAAAMASARQKRPASAPTAAAAPQPAVKRPAVIPGEETDCDTWRRLYEESANCFGPFRVVNGGIKPEAFELCNVVEEPPASRCTRLVP